MSSADLFPQDVMRGWARLGSEAPDLEGVVCEIATCCQRYQVSTVIGDRCAAGWVWDSPHGSRQPRISRSSLPSWSLRGSVRARIGGGRTPTQALAAFKVPRHFRIVARTDLPLTATSKVQKFWLQERLVEELLGPHG